MRYTQEKGKCVRALSERLLNLNIHISTKYIFENGNRDSAVGIATGCGLDDWGIGVRVPVGQEFSHFHIVQTGTRAHPASYPMGTGGLFPRG
jgi:hypothetical protein